MKLELVHLNPSQVGIIPLDRKVFKDNQHHRVGQCPGGGALWESRLLEEFQLEAALACRSSHRYRAPIEEVIGVLTLAGLDPSF